MTVLDLEKNKANINVPVLYNRPQWPASSLEDTKTSKSRKTKYKSNVDEALKVVACFIEWGGKLLLLKRSPGKNYCHHWCLPSGKVERRETLLEAVIRETYEETGLSLRVDELSPTPKRWLLRNKMVNQRSIDLHLFTYSFVNEEPPSIHVNLREHCASAWVELTVLRSSRKGGYLLMPDSDKWLLK